MPIVPFERIVIDTPLPVGEAAARLAAQVEPKRLLRFRRSGLLFEGRMEGTTFHIQRLIGYRNSFLPRIAGSLEATPWGSRLSATLSLHPVVMVFMIVWLGAVLAIGFPAMLMGGDQIGGTRWMPLLMLAFGVAMVSGGFSFEAVRARRALCELLGGSEAGRDRR